jgi:hypothetical protein
MTISSWPRVQAWCSSVCPVCITHTHTNEPILLLLFSVMQTNLLSSVDGFRIFGEQLNEVSQVSPFNTQEERLNVSLFSSNLRCGAVSQCSHGADNSYPRSSARQRTSPTPRPCKTIIRPDLGTGELRACALHTTLLNIYTFSKHKENCKGQLGIII